MTRTALLLALPLLLASCGTTPPQIITQPVNVVVPVKCTPHLDPEPAYPTAAQIVAAPNIFEQVKLLVADRGLRVSYEAELKAAVLACENG